MAKLTALISVGDSKYSHLKVRYTTEDDGFTTVADPVDPEKEPNNSGLEGMIDAYKDTDLLPFAYLNEDDALEILFCNVTTPVPSLTGTDAKAANPVISTGKYTVTTAEVYENGNVYVRALPGDLGKNVTLTVNRPNNVVEEVAGNPQSVIKMGAYLLILGYDSTEVYRVSLAALKTTPEGGECTVEVEIDLAIGSPSIGDFHHGTALLPMVDESEPLEPVPYLFGLFSNTAETSEGVITMQYQSTLVRCAVTDEDAATLAYSASAQVGRNSTGLHEYIDTYVKDEEDVVEPCVLVVAIGGEQNPGETNGDNSHIAKVVAFDAPTEFGTNVDVIIKGDGNNHPPVTQNGTYDAHSLALSGENLFFVTLSYDEEYRACYRYYTGNMKDIIDFSRDPNLEDAPDVSITNLVTEKLLLPVDSGFQEESGWDWDAAFFNTANQLWVIKGSDIQVFSNSTYNLSNLIKEISAGSGNLYDSSFNINAVDLVGELLYPAEEPAKKAAVKMKHNHARLGKHRMLGHHARAARDRAVAAKRAAAAAEATQKAAAKADEEKKSDKE